METEKPAVTWTLWYRHKKDDNEEVGDTYVDFPTARDFADEMVGYHGCFEARVINSKGVEIYLARRGRRKGGRWLVNAKGATRPVSFP